MTQRAAVPNFGSSGSATTGALSTRGGSKSVFLVFVQSWSAINTPTDSASNTWTPLMAEFTGSLSGRAYHYRVWKCENGTPSTTHTVTCTNTGANFITVHFVEVDDANATTMMDAIGTFSSTNVLPATSNSITGNAQTIRIFCFDAQFSTNTGTTWTHESGMAQVSAFTDGTAGPCAEIRVLDYPGGIPYSETIIATSSGTGVDMVLFAVNTTPDTPVVPRDEKDPNFGLPKPLRQRPRIDTRWELTAPEWY